MYLKLTRLDNTPIWINTKFIVTVEPRRQGGAIVVPIGDGLDYDVKESAEDVLARLEALPDSAIDVVPVPPPKSFAKTPGDVSPKAPAETKRDETAPEPTPETTPRKVRARAVTTRTRKTRAKAAAAPEPETPAQAPEDAAPAVPPPAAEPQETTDAPELSADALTRLVKMAPRTVKRFRNTLATQFRITDAQAVLAALQARGVLTLEQDHIVWKERT